jgi:hypothetical protein
MVFMGMSFRFQCPSYSHGMYELSARHSLIADDIVLTFKDSGRGQAERETAAGVTPEAGGLDVGHPALHPTTSGVYFDEDRRDALAHTFASAGKDGRARSVSYYFAPFRELQEKQRG